MKGVLYFVLLFCLSTILSATDLQGNVSGELSKTRSPYHIKADVTVPPDARLKIEPGVVLLFDTTKVFRVEGVLIAVGTKAQPIVFKSSQKAPKGAAWEGIQFTNRSKNESQLQFCRIENARRGVSLFSVSPLIANCEILSSAEDGILCEVSYAKIQKNHIAKNGGNGIHARAFKGIISENDIAENELDGIYLERSDCQISANTLQKNKDDGLFCLNSVVKIKNNRFLQNGDDGILLGNSSTLIFNNVISRCDFGVFAYKNSRPLIVNCTLAGNKYGLYARDNSQMRVESSILWDNEEPVFVDSTSQVTIRYSDVEGGYQGKGNFDLNPQFTDENYSTLSPKTPCNKGGNPMPVYSEPVVPASIVGARIK